MAITTATFIFLRGYSNCSVPPSLPPPRDPPGSICVLCQLPSPPVKPLSAAVHLLHAMSLYHPQRVLAILPLLPLLSADVVGEPPLMPLASLASAEVEYAGGWGSVGPGGQVRVVGRGRGAWGSQGVGEKQGERQVRVEGRRK